MSALAIRFDRIGVSLPELGLWLDPHEPRTGPERVFVSHAHSDHIGLHREVILTKATSRLMHARLSGQWDEHILTFGEPAVLQGREGAFRITLLPAGHIFGSAMALIEERGESLLYTGDFKLRRGRSAEPCAPCHADTLVMETTFGRPAYRFPPTPEVMEGIIRFCREALDNEEIPVLLGYSLGKSQELLCGLAEAGLPIMLHGTVHRLTRVYEQFGQCFPAYEKYESGTARGKVLVCPPNMVNTAMMRNLRPTRLAVLTGWAVDPDCRYRYQAHAAFPLSDHADFPDLIEMVKLVQPQRVYTLHGFAADFAQSLRELGFRAQALGEDEQLTLPLIHADRSSNSALGLQPGAADQESVPIRELPQAQAAGEKAPRPTSQDQARNADHESRNTKHETPTKAQHAPTTDQFHIFALTCTEVGATGKKLEKTARVASYLRTLEPESVRLVSTWFTGHPFAPVENKVLQLGWAIIRDAVCTVTGVDHTGFGQCYLKHSDLGETAFEVLLKSAPAHSSLTIAEVAALFNSIHAARGPIGKLPLLTRILRRCTALEGKYLVKILTGDLRIGLKEGLVEEAIAQAFQAPVQQVKNTNLLLGNIGETAELAQRGQLASANLVPFRPIKFMLASPEETAADIWQRILDWSSIGQATQAADARLPLGPTPGPPTVWLEDKYDGIRCQLHKVGNRVALYSRDLKEITTTFLDIADAVRSAPEDFIIDGELVAMRNDQILPFAELQKRLGRREGDLFLSEQIPVQFVAFDLLWRGGENLLEQPLRTRRARLEQLGSSRLRFSQITRAHSAEDIEKAFADARERGNEGLMIKDPTSTYTPGRRGLSWLKLKKPYATLDCVVVGAEYGHGKRNAVLSDYTFAVRDEVAGDLKVIGKAYTGLTDAEIAQLTAHFKQKAVRQHGRYFEVQPDTVLEIAFDIIQPSNRHNSGLALRFPRIVRIRTDKTPDQIDTLETARRLVKHAQKAANG